MGLAAGVVVGVERDHGVWGIYGPVYTPGCLYGLAGSWGQF